MKGYYIPFCLSSSSPKIERSPHHCNTWSRLSGENTVFWKRKKGDLTSRLVMELCVQQTNTSRGSIGNQRRQQVILDEMGRLIEVWILVAYLVERRKIAVALLVSSAFGIQMFFLFLFYKNLIVSLLLILVKK